MGWLRYPHWQVHLLHCQPVRSDWWKGCWWVQWWPCSSAFGLDSSKKIHGDDNQVTCFEETVYVVKDDPVIITGPAMWQATIRVFSVWEQEEQIISFKLKKEWLNLAWDGKRSPSCWLNHVAFEYGSSLPFHPFQCVGHLAWRCWM